MTVPIADLTEEGFAGAVAAFHDEHLRQYRYSHPENPVETSTLRVAARGLREKRDLRAMRHTARDRAPLPERERDVHFDSHGWLRTRILDRNALAAGDELAGTLCGRGAGRHGGGASRTERPRRRVGNLSSLWTRRNDIDRRDPSGADRSR